MKHAQRFLMVLLFSLLLFPSAKADDGEQVYKIMDEKNQTLTFFAGTPEKGDEYIAGDNRHFQITQVDHSQQTACAKSLGTFQLPDVSWMNENAQSVSAQKRAVAMYCTHSDESYEPTDGTSSKDKGGGIYDVAEAFKKALEADGITVYFSKENHYPHDAGAYRRSRSTAASLVEEGVDAVMDIHRDGIPNAKEYQLKVDGKDASKVRLLVGRSNQNAEANKQFASQIKAVADKIYPGLIKDIYIGKGTYNQDLMSQAVLLEFGTYTTDKKDVLASTQYMANVMNKTLYGGVTGAAGGRSGAQKNTGGVKGSIWILGLFFLGTILFAFVATGSGKAALQKWKRGFQEMTGGAFGDKDRNNE